MWEKVRCRHGDAPPFTSVRAALFSYEMGRAGLYLPKMALLCWILGVSLYGLYIAFWGDPAGRFQKAYFFTTQILPSIALLLPALTWQFYVDRGLIPRKKHKWLNWMARIPVTKQERARAQMKVAAVNLAIALTGVALLNVLSFLLADHAAAAGLLGDAWAHGETSLREVVMICLGPVLVTGLLAWIAMTYVGGILSLFMTAVFGFHCMMMPLVCKAQGCSCSPFETALMVTATWFVLLNPTLMILAMLVVTAWRGLISRRAAWMTAAAWVLVALALYPAALLSGPAWSLPWANAAGLAVGCLCVSAWIVCGWVGNAFRMRGRDLWAVQREDREQHKRHFAPQSRARRRWFVAGFVGVAVFWSWLRWPAEPAVRTTLRNQGLPANSAELNRWYAAVPSEENMALKYQAVKDTMFCQYRIWIKRLDAKAGGASTPERKALEDNVLVCGSAKVGRTQPIPAEVWAATQDYWTIVGRPVSEMLHETARLGMRKSRYPIDLGQGYTEDFRHLAPLRWQARILAIEGWLAAVERRPDDAVNALSDIFPIANSLSDEPIILSQLIRIVLTETAVKGLENVVNRVELSDPLLARMQVTLANAQPPLWQGPFTNRALAGERATSLDYAGGYYLLLPGSGEKEPPEGVVPAAGVALPLFNLLGMDAFERAVFAGSYRRMQNAAEEAARTSRPPDLTAGIPWKETSCLALRAPTVSGLVPGFGRTFESELRIRTQLDLARTALAVERYRLANGKLPERLDMLVPVFLERVPTDPWNDGKPLSCRVKDNGEFVVYSFGKNRTDEKGGEMEDWWAEGDITFTVASPEVREQPQVAP